MCRLTRVLIHHARWAGLTHFSAVVDKEPLDYNHLVSELRGAHVPVFLHVRAWDSPRVCMRRDQTVGTLPQATPPVTC